MVGPFCFVRPIKLVRNWRILNTKKEKHNGKFAMRGVVMLFSSFTFLFWFLPLTLGLYFLPTLLRVKHKRRKMVWQNATLLVASLFFYAFGEPIYVLLMLGTALVNAVLAWQIPKARHARIPLIVAIVLDVGLLVFFKYPPLIGLQAPSLPLGISFYTFQALSYVCDVYMKRASPSKNPLTVCLYVALFPQLVAGPIVRYTDVEQALYHREVTASHMAGGISRFATGLAKKVLLANSAGAIFTTFITNSTPTFLGAWCALLSFAFQIYFDFSGYTDMAIGLGALFGFRFPENFHYPYMARNVTDFWKRWHITLSSFFREYVYIPLGGNRLGIKRTLLNLLIVWSLTGLWHGASLNFVLWGLYYFALLLLEKFVFSRVVSRISSTVSIPITFLLTLFGWLLFAFDGGMPQTSLSALPRFVTALFGAGGMALGADLYDALRALPILLACAIAATPFPRRLFRRLTMKKGGALLRATLPLFALLLSIAALADAGYNPFLYLRF